MDGCMFGCCFLPYPAKTITIFSLLSGFVDEVHSLHSVSFCWREICSPFESARSTERRSTLGTRTVVVVTDYGDELSRIERTLGGVLGRDSTAWKRMMSELRTNMQESFFTAGGNVQTWGGIHELEPLNEKLRHIAHGWEWFWTKLFQMQCSGNFLASYLNLKSTNNCILMNYSCLNYW